MKRHFRIVIEAITEEAIQAAEGRINACVAEINDTPIKAVARIEALGGLQKHIGLTDREMQALQLLAAGKSNKQIAYELGLSEATVKTHNAHAFRKIGVANRTQAAGWALANGIATSEREGASC